jgi:hypothetical protein
MIYKLTIAPIAYNRKPTKAEVGIIKNNLIPTGTTYSQLLVHSVYPKCYTVLPGYYTGSTFNNQCLVSQQVYYLDFDATISVQEVLDRFKSFGITPNFYYTTFRHTEDFPRFRVVLLTDLEITDQKTAADIRNGLKRAFPEADKSCFDAARIFFGGKESFPITEKPVPFDKLFLMISLVSIEVDNGKTLNIPKRVSLNNYNRDTRFGGNDYDAYLTHLYKYKENKVDFEKLALRVKIFEDFLNGKWLYHNELFGIATSLHWLKGGQKLFKDTMKKYNNLGLTNYDKYKFRLMTYVSHMEYFPMALSNFSPYKEDCEHKNLITGIKLPIGKIERIKQPEYISLEYAQNLFEKEFKAAIQAQDNNIYIFKLPTGFGKTTHLTNLENQVLAFPTHDLKDEVYRKMKVKSFNTPERPKFTDTLINNKIDQYYLMGLNEAVIKIIRSVASKSDSRTNDQDALLAQKYLQDIKTKKDDNATLLATHQRIILGDTEENTVIFDEDPIKDLLSVDDTTLDDIILVNEKLPKENKFNDLIETLKNAEPGIVYSMSSIQISRDVLSETISKNNTKTNVVKFLNSIAFIRNNDNSNRIDYIVKRELNPQKKYIVMSATAQVHLYEKLYPNRVKVLDLSNIQIQGTIFQHTDYSYSRTSLTDDLIFDLRDRVGNIPIISFKRNKKKFGQMDLQMHFWKLLGYDGLNGSDIAIIGTPHFNEVTYRLFAFAVGIDPNTERDMKIRHIEYGDFRFCFMTYESKQMQQIQLSLIESELIQAVGRARLLRNDCVVELFSNFPINNSQLSIIN